MTRAGAAIVVLLLATGPDGAAAQDKKDKDGDKIGKDKAPVVLKKALAEIQKKKGAAVVEDAEMGAGPRKMKANYEGVMKKDFAAVKGAAEVYARGSTYLVNSGGHFDPPEDTPDGAGGGSFKNPSLLIDEVGKVGSAPQFGPDEMVDGKDCKVVDVAADPALLKQQLRDFGERLNKMFKAQAQFGGAQVFDFRNMTDEKNSAATYHICVGKDDLLIYRIDYVLRPKLKPGSLPPQMRLPEDMDQKVDVKFSKWDEDHAMEIPGVVKAKWGIK